MQLTAAPARRTHPAPPPPLLLRVGSTPNRLTADLYLVMDRHLLERRLGRKIPRKTLYLVRHGQSTHNAHCFAAEGADLNSSRYVDAPLTSLGESQARELADEMHRINPQVVVSSPLTRATQTCLLASRRIPDTPHVVHPLCAERLAYSCDIGRPVAELQAQFPRVDYGLVKPAEAWWWMPEGLEERTGGASLELLRKHEAGAYRDCEPAGVFAKRANDFRVWLLERPETKIAVFAHGVFLTQFLGDRTVRFRNCEVRKVVI